jgi:malonate decarboxylase gamma subunit
MARQQRARSWRQRWRRTALSACRATEPTVMDLPSMSRVTKLPEDKLKEFAKTTPVFAPGLDHLFQMGAVAEIWDPKKPLDEQLEQTLRNASSTDTRDELGAQRKGRLMTAVVAKRVIAEATGQMR